MARFSLMRDEEMKLKVLPHPLSFLHLYFVFLLLLLWGQQNPEFLALRESFLHLRHQRSPRLCIQLRGPGVNEQCRGLADVREQIVLRLQHHTLAAYEQGDHDPSVDPVEKVTFHTKQSTGLSGSKQAGTKPLVLWQSASYSDTIVNLNQKGGFYAFRGAQRAGQRPC